MDFLNLLITFLVLTYGGTSVGSVRFLKKGSPDLGKHGPRKMADRWVESHHNSRGKSDEVRDTGELRSDAEVGDVGRRLGGRSQRAAFIVDGTVWCGIGDTAEAYSDLGDHRETDLCCRDHDHCPEKIFGFTCDFGVFNYRPYTINLCSCDESFRQCLLASNTIVSREVGQFFFNILRPACFELSSKPTKRCIRRNWWGFCREYGVTSKAIVGVNKRFNRE